MIGETLEATLDLAIVVTMIVLIAYPSALALKEVLHERRARRVRIAQRNLQRDRQRRAQDH